MKKFFVLILLSLILSRCKKKDTISSQTIHGQVYNLCTDSGMANITVYLSTGGAALNPATTLSAISDANGNFSFNHAQIHSSSEYEYSLYIPSKSGIGGVDVGFDGGGWVLDKNKLGTLFVLDVVPHFKYLHFLINPSIHITYPDTITVLFQQNTFHKNLSNYPYSLGFATPDIQQGYPHYSTYTIGNYPMGWWNIKIKKTKGGVNTITSDSIYIGYDATVIDTIPW